jgi:hypothetical protein
MKLLSDVGPMKSYFGRFGDGAVSMQDRCTVSAKQTMGSEIILDTHMELLHDMGPT